MADLHDDDLLQRWDRIGIGIRCAYNPWLPPVILLYLQAGRRLVSAGILDDATVQRRMLAVLMQAAGDEALPWPWRAACLAQTVRPRARLARLLSGEPGALAGVDRALEEAHARLDAALLTNGCIRSRSTG